MSARAYLPADYSNAVVDAFEGLRGTLLKRQAQNLIAAEAADNEHQFNVAMAVVATYRAVLDDIAIAIAKEQGR